MTDALPLLTTRLTLPPVRPGRVARPRLAERLDAGLACALTLVSAPAGFGKTTLVVDWLRQNEELRMENREVSTSLFSILNSSFKTAWLALSEDEVSSHVAQR
jgi:hypothetical protein